MPVPVLFTNARTRAGASVVQIDNVLGGRMAAEHLLEQGYENIGVITGPLDWVAAQERLEGWRQVMSKWKCDHPPLPPSLPNRPRRSPALTRTPGLILSSIEKKWLYR